MLTASRFFSSLAVILALSIVSSAKTSRDRTQFNHDIRVEPGEQVGDVSCLNCNIYIGGQVAGDVTAYHGNVVVAQDALVAGDITTVLGDARVDKGTKVAGDVTVVGGVFHRHPEAIISGDITSQSKVLVLLMMAGVVVVLGSIIMLIIWLVQRSRRRTFAAASSGNPG